MGGVLPCSSLAWAAVSVGRCLCTSASQGVAIGGRSRSSFSLQASDDVAVHCGLEGVDGPSSLREELVAGSTPTFRSIGSAVDSSSTVQIPLRQLNRVCFGTWHVMSFKLRLYGPLLPRVVVIYLRTPKALASLQT